MFRHIVQKCSSLQNMNDVPIQIGMLIESPDNTIGQYSASKEAQTLQDPAPAGGDADSVPASLHDADLRDPGNHLPRLRPM